MALNQNQQLHEAFHRAHSVLVICRAHPSVDSVVAAAALAEFLKRAGKTVEVVSDNFSNSLPPQKLSALQFLPEVAHIKDTVGTLHQFIISLNVGANGLESFHYDVTDNELTMYLTPKNGVFAPEMVRTSTSDFRYDLIAVVGAPDFLALGSMYATNTALFDTVPVVNIDCSPTNEFFGHINFVDMTLTSVSEAIYSILTANDTAEITPNIAQLILTGMISATKSFRTTTVNARTLNTASALIGLGADREKIIHNLYNQRSVATLKLWGLALSHIQSDPQLPLLLSTLTREDFARAGADEQDLADLVDELISTAPNAKVFALIYEQPSNPESLCVVVDAQKPYTAAILTNGFVDVDHNHRRSSFYLENISLADGATKVTNVLRSKMRL